MVSPRAVVARGDWRAWNPEQYKKQERKRVSKRNAVQNREKLVQDLESRLWCVIERLGSVETELARLGNLNCETRLNLPDYRLPFLPDSGHLNIDIHNIDDQSFSQCYLSSESGTSDFPSTQYPQDAPACLSIDELIPPIPESELTAALQLNDFINGFGEVAELPLPLLAAASAQPSHPSDPDPEEVMSPNGFEITEEFEEMIALVHTLNGTRRVRTEHDINEDFLIRAVLKGWLSVFQFEYGRTCPLWAILYRVDRVLYENCSVALRLAHLRAIYRMFMFIMFKKPVPKWYTPKARSYQFSPGNLLTTADFLPQPEVREQVRFQKKPLTNDFWSWLSNCATFNCPLEPSQMYYQKEGLYGFSKTFTDHFEELGNWNFHDAMKMRFPAVFGQISLPRWSLTPPRCEEAAGYQKGVTDIERLELVECTRGFYSGVGGQNIRWPSQFSFA